MADPWSVFDRAWTIHLTRRTDGGYANDDGTWVAKTVTTTTIKGHLIIGPYEELNRTADHIMSGRAKQVGLVLEKGEAILWTSDDVRRGDILEPQMDVDGTEESKRWLVVDELSRPHLIEKLTGLRKSRKQFKLKAGGPNH